MDVMYNEIFVIKSSYAYWCARKSGTDESARQTRAYAEKHAML